MIDSKKRVLINRFWQSEDEPLTYHLEREARDETKGISLCGRLYFASTIDISNAVLCRLCRRVIEKNIHE